MRRLGTRRELEALRLAGEAHPDLASLYAKLTAVRVTTSGVDLAKVEGELVRAAQRKYVQAPLLPAQYVQASRQLAMLQATPDQAAEVGRWLARQAWIKQPVTLSTVIKKWGEWLSKARAEGAREDSSAAWRRDEQEDDG